MTDGAPGGLSSFAECAEAIAATRSKNAKVTILAGYLAGLDAVRLPVATRYFSGLVFPTWDGRVLLVGWAALRDVLLELSGVDERVLFAVWSRHADIGDTTAELFRRRPPSPAAGSPDLRDADRAFAAMASAGSSRERTAALRDLLARCGPLEAKYVTKLIAGEMRIGLRAGLVEEAIGTAFGRDPAQVARADMLVGDLGEVAGLARDGRLETAAPRLHSPIRFMLASPVADAGEAVGRLGEDVWVEDKYDGIRCQLHAGGGRVRLFSRDLKDITDQFPEVARSGASLGRAVILDGEVLAFRDGRVLPFAALQRRLGRKAPPEAILAEVPAVHVAWDLLWEEGQSLLDLPLTERRRRLESLPLPPGMLLSHREAAHGAAAVDRLFDDARQRLNEGLMLKVPASPYLPGRRGLYWLKLKRPLDTLDCVVIGAEWGHGKRRGVLSDVTFGVLVDGTDQLVPVGKAYSGLSDQEIAEMTELLQAATVEVRGRYHRVVPEIVLEVAFDAVRRSSRHRSGYALRFPRIARWRHDKPVAEISLVSDVERLVEVRERGREQRVERAERAG
ncbi:MAG TPA: ATP-dependent DNA ligase [Candidatus Binatia bacterium]|nr:ATP-dependent DNA ligase [Candidatus Binatia bacterium]